ncbi:uncharacterized protein YraI [Brucella pseudogrignonensis]|uniref:Uncharacterized protein YraI n=2 Tax=Brucella pseudogrignonensis TaxID=419475 RepID=A0ABU1MAD6_9HYPH|nr:uncharacterized protein YraI [Brucella pseudogrignonensis]
MYLFDFLTSNRFFGALVLTSLFLVPSTVFAAPATVNANVNLRTGPGSNYGRLASLPAGMGVDAGPCRGSWCQVRTSFYRGWVSSRFLSFSRYAPAPNYPMSRGARVTIGDGVEIRRRPTARPGYDPYQPDPARGPAPGYDPYRDTGPSAVPPIGGGVRPMRSPD